ncbi:MAG: orotidine-5'-phosphate decarboxylase [Alphaproteobacteria bacterium]|nr:orotidine-5'-phosphate decarboxylase [Alphaproteobacteria bacterium]
MTNHKKILVALDTPNISAVQDTIEQVGEFVGGFKLGLEFFNYNGVDGLKTAMTGKDNFLFLDLKFHDIPNTVAGAIRGCMSGVVPNMITIHTSGGFEMMKRAKEESALVASKLGVKAPLIVGVTVLTALDNNDMQDIGYSNDTKEQAIKLAKLAKRAGLDGIVCSAFEIESIKKACGDDFILVVPGIRPQGVDSGDQKRIMTPEQAIEKGADYLVIGRPITQAQNQREMAKQISLSLDK